MNNSNPAAVHLTVIGWIVAVLLLYAANKTDTGHEVIYYGLILIMIYLFAANWPRIQPILLKGATGQ